MNIGPLEIAFVVGLVILLFGPDKLPQLAKSVGKATREYKNVLQDVSNTGTNFVSETKDEENLKSNLLSNSNEEDQLFQNAKSLGISTNGKTTNQLIEEILEKTSTN